MIKTSRSTRKTQTPQAGVADCRSSCDSPKPSPLHPFLRCAEGSPAPRMRQRLPMTSTGHQPSLHQFQMRFALRSTCSGSGSLAIEVYVALENLSPRSPIASLPLPSPRPASPLPKSTPRSNETLSVIARPRRDEIIVLFKNRWDRTSLPRFFICFCKS